MKKTTVPSIFFLIVLSIYTTAWVNCTPSVCPAGYTDNGEYCEGGHCYRNCTGLSCDGTWTQVFADTTFSFGGYGSKEDETSSDYTTSNTSACYRFYYEAGQNFELDVKNLTYNPPSSSATNCDGEAIAGFQETVAANPWFENLTDTYSTSTYPGTMPRYWGQVSHSTFDYFYIAARSHTNTDSSDDNNYDPPMKTSHSIYCAPTAKGCNVIANHSINCDVGCYGKATKARIAQGCLKDYTTLDNWNNDNDGLRQWTSCANGGNTNLNVYRYPKYYVYTMPTIPTSNATMCERTNEAPTASNVKVIPEYPTAGDDLICDYDYYDKEGYEEKDSTYEWWKNSVNQNIDSKVLGKGNISVSDSWYCKVTPKDGLLSGTKQQSSNTVTILTTVQDVKMYVEDELAYENPNGYYNDETDLIDFNEELNNALDSCVPDAQGYCNITMSYSSNTNGRVNLSKLEVYYWVNNITLPQIQIDMIHPSQDIEVNKNEFFKIILNVSCHEDYCGDINVTLDPIAPSTASESLWAWYCYEEDGYNNTLLDCSGNGRHMDQSYNITAGQFITSSISDSANRGYKYNEDAETKWFNTNLNHTYLNYNDFTVLFLYKNAEVTHEMQFYGLENNNGKYIRLNANGEIRVRVCNGGTELGPWEYVYNNPHEYAFTGAMFNGSHLEVVDNETNHIYSEAMTPCGSSKGYHLGWYPNYNFGSASNMTMYDVLVYNRSLSLSERTAIFNELVVKKGKGIVPVGSGTPFYTNATSNPVSVNLNKDQHQISW